MNAIQMSTFTVCLPPTPELPALIRNSTYPRPYTSPANTIRAQSNTLSQLLYVPSPNHPITPPKPSFAQSLPTMGGTYMQRLNFETPGLYHYHILHCKLTVEDTK